MMEEILHREEEIAGQHREEGLKKKKVDGMDKLISVTQE